MVCSSCDSSNPENNRFCGQCGARLPAPAATPVEAAETVIVPTGPVSSAFREEVEQQQYQLRRLQRRAGDRGAESERTAMPEVERRATDRKLESPPRADVATHTTEWERKEDGWQPIQDSFGHETNIAHEPNGGPVAYGTSNAPFAEETQVIGSRAATSVPAEDNYQEPPISGPSFLGLGEPERDPKSNLSYLYEDEPRSGRARYWIAALIVIACAAFFVYEWKQNWNWDTTIIGRHKAEQAHSGKPGGESAPEAGASADKASQQTATAAQGSTPAGQPPSATNAPAAVQSDNPAGASSTPAPGDGIASTAPMGSTDPAHAAGTNESKSAEQPGEKAGGTVSQSNTAQNADAGKPARAAGAKPSGQQSAGADDGGSLDDEAGQSREEVADVPPARGSKRAPAKPVSGRYAEKEPGSEMVAKAEKYLYGRGVPKNCDQALVYLRTAANRGNADARSKLGALYATGHCVSMDRAEAYNWFTLAREAGSKNMWVERNRQMLWSQMTQDEKARTLGP